MSVARAKKKPKPQVIIALEDDGFTFRLVKAPANVAVVVRAYGVDVQAENVKQDAKGHYQEVNLCPKDGEP